MIVLAMHGVPPNDFPGKELAEFFSLHARLESPGGIPPQISQRYAELETKMRNWPRTRENDPFSFASQELAQGLAEESGNEVITGYNEFCAPGLDEALESAVQKGAGRVVVVTPMMTRGGDHAEREIPELVRRFRNKHPEVEFIYAWPFEVKEVSRFLTVHLNRFLGDS